MVQINKVYDFPKVELFDENYNSVGIISNECELADVRLQISKKRLDGYFCIVNDNPYTKAYIDNNGAMDTYDDPNWDFMKNLLNLITEIIKNK